MTRFRKLRIDDMTTTPSLRSTGNSKPLPKIITSRSCDSDIAGYNKLLELAKKQCESEYNDTSLWEHRKALQSVLNSQSQIIMQNILESNGDKRRLQEMLGFTLEVKDSTITHPESGKGLFLKGSAQAGSILGYFPGTIHLAEHLKSTASLERFASDPNYLILQRFDECVIDMRDYYSRKHEVNPLAMGQYINHPPSSTKMLITNNDAAGNNNNNSNNKKKELPVIPNVIQLMYNSNEMEHDLADLIPNKYHRQSSILGTIDKSTWNHGMVFLSLVDLKEGDELFLNYRLNPKSEMKPPWYEDVVGDGGGRWGEIPEWGWMKKNFS